MTLGDKCIIAKNENEIRELQALKARVINNTDEAIKELRKQNREIKGRY
ncbi:hypothetical protein QTL86_11325 [Cellulosilyticum sp. ST5]